jgi:hypothetical protein
MGFYYARRHERWSSPEQNSKRLNRAKLELIKLVESHAFHIDRKYTKARVLIILRKVAIKSYLLRLEI